MFLAVAFCVSIVGMILAISWLKIHPFLAIMGTSLLLAIGVGIPLSKVPLIIGDGFNGMFSSIGIVIILGALIGTILEQTGAAVKLAEVVLRVVGRKNPALAMELMGWIVSIPVFCDSGFVILDPVRKSIQRNLRCSSAMLTVALSGGLYVSHVLIPPTPGPIAAAQSLGAGDYLLQIIGFGVLFSIPALISVWIFAKFIGKRVKSSEDGEFSENGEISSTFQTLIDSYGKTPNGFWSALPIFVPVFLLGTGTICKMALQEGILREITLFLGSPMIALACGLLFATVLLVKTGRLGKMSEMANETLKTVGPILFITAAGGTLGKVVEATAFAEILKTHADFLRPVGIFFPFLLAAILKTAQGSSTVAIGTTAGILGSFAAAGSMMSVLGFTTPTDAILVVMAIGAGAMTVSHANDSYFWVVTNFGGLTPQNGYRTQTALTFVMGVTTVLAVWVFSLIYHAFL